MVKICFCRFPIFWRWIPRVWDRSQPTLSSVNNILLFDGNFLAHALTSKSLNHQSANNKLPLTRAQLLLSNISWRSKSIKYKVFLIIPNSTPRIATNNQIHMHYNKFHVWACIVEIKHRSKNWTKLFTKKKKHIQSHNYRCNESHIMKTWIFLCVDPLRAHIKHCNRRLNNNIC